MDVARRRARVCPHGALIHQVLDLRVDEGKHDCAGSVQDGSALDYSSVFGAPSLRLEVEVDGVQRHGEEVSEQGHRFGRQPGNTITSVIVREENLFHLFISCNHEGLLFTAYSYTERSPIGPAMHFPPSLKYWKQAVLSSCRESGDWRQPHGRAEIRTSIRCRKWLHLFGAN